MNAENVKGILARAVIDEPGSGTFGVAREIFTDRDIFDLEMTHIFEANWVFAAHESQLRNPHDFYSTYIGRQPVVIARREDGTLGGFINSCAHRGATVCRDRKGNRPNFTCPFHGWSYDSAGKLVKLRGLKKAGYPSDFDFEKHSLAQVPRVESYRGFIFCSLSANVEPLAEYLGQTKTFVDLIVDQSPNGLEVLRGSSTYQYRGNWKLQAENGADGYHVPTTHFSYVSTLAQRKSGKSQNDIRAMDFTAWDSQEGGCFAFPNGHILLWMSWANPEDRPVFAQYEKIKKDAGDVRARWMVERLRNLLIYPNVFLMDQASTQIRIIRPIDVDLTEITIYAFGPVNEDAGSREKRIRQYEDFFNASGMATPDDLEEFTQSQVGFGGSSARVSDLSRGATHWVRGADDEAKRLGIRPILSGVRLEDEGLFVVQHRAWQERLRIALDRQESGRADR